MSKVLAGKRIAVTGASRGLGRSFALAFASHGAAVVVNGTNIALLDELAGTIRALGGQVEVVPGSVADDDVTARIVRTCVDEFGGIDVLVNNAGVVRDRTLLRMTTEEFDEVIAVNLRGTWSASRHAAQAMSHSGGLLLQIISMGAFVGSIGASNYTASKAGVVGMLYAWDLELRRYGIRTNAICPVAQTDMTQVIFDRARAGTPDEGAAALTPESLGFGQPDEIAQLAVLLCSDRASHLRSQIFTFTGSKLSVWRHPEEVVLRRRPSWTIDELDGAIRDASMPVQVLDYN